MGISACVIMPKNTTPNKIENVKRYGGEIVFCEPNISSREETLYQMVLKNLLKTGYPNDWSLPKKNHNLYSL